MQSSAFDILGPIMVGPSSSHTAGALRIAQVARSIAPKDIVSVHFDLFNSFADTHEGHGSDKALLAGILGLAADDERICDAYDIAHDKQLVFAFAEHHDEELHPNTIAIHMELVDGTKLSIQGISVGGGKVKLSQINGVAIDLDAEDDLIFISHKDYPGVLAKLCSILADKHINIASIRNFRTEKSGDAYTTLVLDVKATKELLTEIEAIETVNFVSYIALPRTIMSFDATATAYDFNNAQQALDIIKTQDIASFGELMKKREIELCDDAIQVDAHMQNVIEHMRNETQATVERPCKSQGGFLFEQAQQVHKASSRYAQHLAGNVLSSAMAKALATQELSASMGVIVAAPTAGSAGVVPAVIFAIAESLDTQDKQLAENALWCAAAIGAIISHNATVAGAEGGCQAEVGSASAMAAASAVQMLGGTPEQCLHAASFAISNLLGLVCDPVLGLVEYPCQIRNVIGVSAAITSAQMALSGMESPIPFDEVVEAQFRVGHALPETLRETARGGLAQCPSVCTKCQGCSE